MRVNLSNVKLKLKIVKPTKRVEPKEIPPKKLTKLVNGKVILIDGKYYCFVQYYDFNERLFGNTDIIEITDIAKSLNIPFTEESYDIKQFRTIFTRDKTKYGYLSLVRTESQIVFGNYNPDKYVPFAPNWIVRGWIVKINNVLQFKFRNLVTINGYDYRYKGLLDDDEFEWFKANKYGKK